MLDNQLTMLTLTDMFAKLFSRITESSLMEEPIDVRYTFMMMLAISDPNGYVIGTNIAIARRMNMPVADFERCLGELMKPDPHSNSMDEEGRRIVPSDGERGFRVVNYLVYRDMKSEEGKREYMREYMRKRRAAVNRVNQDVNPCKPLLANVTHAEEEEDAEETAKERPVTKRNGIVTHELFPDDSLKTKPKAHNPKEKNKGTQAELEAYAVEIGLEESDGEFMFDHWEANGWRNGHAPVKDWRAGIRKWKAQGWLPSQKQVFSGRRNGNPQDQSCTATGF